MALDLTNAGTIKYVSLPSGKVKYNVAGSGPAVIFLHGSGPGATGWSNFGPNMVELAERFTCYAPDMPGWGDSDPVAPGERNHVRSALEFMDELGLDRAAFVGNSMGGATSIRFAVENPQRLSHLITMGAGVRETKIFGAGDGPTEGLKILRKGYRQPSMETMLELVDTEEITDGSAASSLDGRGSRLYAMPRNVMFAGAVSAATLGICSGLLRAFTELTRTRDGRYGKSSLDPYQLASLGQAAADIDASICHFLSDIDRVYDQCVSGRSTPLSLRAEVRRNQVRATNRAVDAAATLFKVAGGVSLREDLDLERLWRDSQSAIHHVQNVEDPIFQAWGLDYFGYPVPPAIKF